MILVSVVFAQYNFSVSFPEEAAQEVFLIVKTAITEKPESCKDEEFTVKYLTVFAEYCENPNYKVPKSAFIKKMIKAIRRNYYPTA